MNSAALSDDDLPGFPHELPFFHGERGGHSSTDDIPASITVAISREAGSRGKTIGIRAARKLGWQVFHQEMLEYTAHEGAFRQGVMDGLSPRTVQWVEDNLQRLAREERLSGHPTILELARIILVVGAQGDAVLIGRGAGNILPRATTLHVRTIAPLDDRVTYMSQWLRMTRDEASREVALRDGRRAEFVAEHFQRRPDDIYQYDLLLNSGLLGEEVCAELIAQAARAKLSALRHHMAPAGSPAHPGGPAPAWTS